MNNKSTLFMGAVIILLSIGFVLDRGAVVLNGNPGDDRRDDSLVKRVVRAVSNWFIDTRMKDPPPPIEKPESREERIARQQTFMYMPATKPSEFLRSPGDDLDHREGW